MEDTPIFKAFYSESYLLYFLKHHKQNSLSQLKLDAVNQKDKFCIPEDKHKFKRTNSQGKFEARY